MIEILEKVQERYRELNLLLSDPQVLQDQNKYKKTAKEQAELSEIVELYSQLKQVLKQMEEDEKIKSGSQDKELVELAKAELEELEEKKKNLEEKLKLLLIPRDPNDSKNSIVEIRAGTGGEEAALFAADLYRMYAKYSEKKDGEQRF